MTRQRCAEYLGESLALFHRRVNEDARFPKPVPDPVGKRPRWDKRAIDRYIDGLVAENTAAADALRKKVDALMQGRRVRARAARRAALARDGGSNARA